MRARQVVGLVLCIVGLIWFGQGIGLIPGSFMTGQAIWAVFGALAIVVGGALVRGRGRRGVTSREDGTSELQ